MWKKLAVQPKGIGDFLGVCFSKDSCYSSRNRPCKLFYSPKICTPSYIYSCKVSLKSGTTGISAMVHGVPVYVLNVTSVIHGYCKFLETSGLATGKVRRYAA